MIRSCFLAGLLILLFCTTSFAATIRVPSEQPTIQAGVNEAFDGDTVLIAKGSYTGLGNRDIELLGKQIVLLSEDGPDSTIIDCQASAEDPHRGFNIHSGEDSNAVIEGLTITGGFTYGGGGMYCENSSLNIKSCNFVDNHGITTFSYGGAIQCKWSSLVLTDCTFISNSAGDKGGAICSFESSVTLDSCLFEYNSLPQIGSDPLEWWEIGGGAILSYSWDGSGSLTVTNSTFRNNTSVFGCFNIQTWFIPTTIDNCTFSGGDVMNPYYERAGVQTGSVHAVVHGCSFTDLPGYAYFSAGGQVTLSNCTIARNVAGIACCWWGGIIDIENSIIYGTTTRASVDCQGNCDISVSCSDIYGNADGNWVDCIADQAGINGNFSLNPVFCDPDNGDYTITDWSPCAPDNNECGILIGALGIGCSLPWICGDTDANGVAEISDAISIISYVFGQGPPPLPVEAGDVDCNGIVEVSDVVYLISYIFVPGSAPPCDPDDDGVPDC